MSEWQEIINQVAPYFTLVTFVGGPIALGTYMVRGILKQNKEQYQELQSLREEFENNSKRFGKEELIALHKKLKDMQSGFLCGQKGQELNSFIGQIQSRLQPFIKDEIVLAVYPDHPFAGREAIHLEELQGQQLILREEGSGTRHKARRLSSL